MPSTTTPKRVTFITGVKTTQQCGCCTKGGDTKGGCGQPIQEGGPTYQVGTRYYHPDCLPQAAKDALGLDPAPVATGPSVTVAQAKALEALSALTGGAATVDEADVRRICKDLLDTARPIEVISGGVPVGKSKGAAHPLLEECARLASVRLPILLVGPAGSGKSYLGEQLAETLGLDFADLTCTAGMGESNLKGRLLPTGKGLQMEYHRSEFVRLYEEGGVFLLDEVDAADPNTLLLLNTAIANGHMSIDERKAAGLPARVKRHPDFIVIAAANTFGHGANRMYCGRNALDEAFLDRFKAGTREMGYDEKLEADICGSKILARAFQRLRAKVEKASLQRIISMRGCINFAKCLAGGPNAHGWLTLDECIALLTQDWTDEERKACGLPTSAQ